MNQYLLSQKIAFSDLTVFTNEPIEGAATCMSCDCNKPDIYIKAKANIEKELNKIGFTKANSPKMSSKAIKPQLKEQMMVCSVDTECTFAETSCCDCSRGGTYDTIKGINKKHSTGFSKQLTDYCRDNMIVCRAENKCEYEKLPMEAFVVPSCVGGRCQITISTGGVDTQPEKPATPIDPIKKKTTIDLSHQELYYREDKDTNKIKYAIISSNDKSICGDNICSLKENYLYKLDLAKSCSVYADKVINFSHCHQDCKNATEQLTGVGISKEEFNALELSCTNQTEKPKQPEKTNKLGVPMPAKPIAEMNEAEKNAFKMQLQTFLIQLLTQYLTLMKR